ncbi:MAG: type II toxin-antitoxin system RelE family toxin [Rubrobacteraceae bacterium]
MNHKRGLAVHRVGVENLLELPKNIQRQALKKMRQVIEVAPESAGYPLRGFRGIHSGRYRIIWRLLTLEDGERFPEVVYVGIRSEGDERDACREVEKILGGLEGL